jgi:hypothetical protein
VPGFDELGSEIGSFVSSDGSGNAEDDFHEVQNFLTTNCTNSTNEDGINEF